MVFCIALEVGKPEEKQETHKLQQEEKPVYTSQPAREKVSTKRSRRAKTDSTSRDNSVCDNVADEKIKPKKKKRKTKVEKEKTPESPVPEIIDPNEPVYCLCQQVSFGEMVGCDYEQCPIEWFHFSCVKLVTKPKGKWFCPRCRGENSKTCRYK